MQTFLYIFTIILLIVNAYAVQEKTRGLTYEERQELLNKPTTIRWRYPDGSVDEEPLVTVKFYEAYGELWTYIPTKEDYEERLQARRDLFWEEY
jgi:hypothetical protein